MFVLVSLLILGIIGVLMREVDWTEYNVKTFRRRRE